MSSDSSASSSSAASSEVSKLFLHNMIDRIRLVPRVIRSKNGKPGETQLVPVNLDNPNTNLRFILGDADAKQLCRVIRAPGTFENKGVGAYTMALLLPKPHDEGAKHLWDSLVKGMKETGVLDASISTHPDVMKLVAFPPIYEGNDGGVIMSVTLGDDVEYYLKIHKGVHKGNYAKITRDHIRKGDMVVVSVRLDRHRDKPKHGFARYVQCVYVIERGSKLSGVPHVVGSAGDSITVVDYDPEMEEEEGAEAENAGTGGAAGSGSGSGSGSSDPTAPAAKDEEEDEFAQALKRARTET